MLTCSHAHSLHATASRSECRSQAADSVNFGFDFALVITSEAVGMKVFHGFAISGLGQYVNLRSFRQDLRYCTHDDRLFDINSNEFVAFVEPCELEGLR